SAADEVCEWRRGAPAGRLTVKRLTDERRGASSGAAGAGVRGFRPGCRLGREGCAPGASLGRRPTTIDLSWHSCFYLTLPPTAKTRTWILLQTLRPEHLCKP